MPADDVTRHTGAGRFSRLRMRPMTLFETGRSTGAMSLSALLDGEVSATSESGPSITELADLLTVGGWPALQGMRVPDAAQTVRDYLDQIRRVDVGRVGNVRRDPERVGRMIRALARNVATESRPAPLPRTPVGSTGRCRTTQPWTTSTPWIDS